MKIGLFAVNAGARARATAIVGTARVAEQAGMDSLWGGEHIVLADPPVPRSPIPPTTTMLEPLIALSWAAAHTTTIKLATGILLVPQRNPLALAKELATLDFLSGGRVILGIGTGALEPEFRAIGANFAERGAVTDEYLDAMASLWYDDKPEFHGRFVDFDGVDAHPRPVQQPIPVVVGGHSAPAYRRTITRGHGWYGFRLTPDEAATCLEGIRHAADVHERPAALGEVEITVTPPGPLTAEDAAAYAELGVDRLVVLPTAGGPPNADGVPEGLARVIDDTMKAVAAL